MDYSGFALKDSYHHFRSIPSEDDVRPWNNGQMRSAGLTSESGTPRDADSSLISLDPLYKQKLRSGFIDFRNTIIDSKYRGVIPYSKAPSGYNDQDRVTRGSDIQMPLASKERAFQNRSYKKVNERRKLYRSSSSLELDHCNNDVVCDVYPPMRDFGSANSLNAVQPSGNDFSTWLQSYRQDIEDLDRYASAKRSKDGETAGSGLISNHFGVFDQDLRQPCFSSNVSGYQCNPKNSSVNSNTLSELSEIQQSPKAEAKFSKSKETKLRNEGASGGGGIFRKLRGVKSDPSTIKLAESNLKSDGSIKAFSHYDCQSISVKISEVIKRRAELTNGMSFKKLNVTTGASAASVSRIAQSNSTTDLENATLDQLDLGDGKSNDLLLSCSYFHNEFGEEEVRTLCLIQSSEQNRSHQMTSENLVSDPLCNGVAVLDCSSSPHGVIIKSFHTFGGYLLEYFDYGAYYYRHFFNEYDHQNFFGIDENIGPVAISIRREKVYDKDYKSSSDKADGAGWFHQYRIIVRTSELTSLRGSILEDNIPSSSRLSSAKGLLAKDILDFVVPNLNTSCMHQAVAGSKTSELLMKVDEQGISKAYKMGIMFCRAGQATEEEMYNNEFSSPAFDEFLNLIATRIKLKGFEGYRGGLDIKSDSTGVESFHTKLDDNEIIFHVSTLLPFTSNNKQQLLRKRHIGNDIVTIIFQEPGALPFTPKSIRSQFQHVFIVVRVHNPNSENTRYSVAVSRSKDVPFFGPLIPEGAVFNKSEQFKNFLLAKAVNAENAVHKSDKFIAMAVRTRQEYLKDLALNHVVSSSIDSGSRLSKLTLGSGRKKDKARLIRIPDIHTKGAVVWSVTVKDSGFVTRINGLIGIANEMIVFIEEISANVLFVLPCQSVIGWSFKQSSLKLYYNSGECIQLSADGSELKEIVSRLEIVTDGCQADEKNLYRSAEGHLGFLINNGIVSEIDTNGPAFRSGLRSGSQIVEVCDMVASTLTHDELVDCLRNSKTVSVVLIPPHNDGTIRSYRTRGHQNALSGIMAEFTRLTDRQNHHVQHVVNSSNHSSLERQSGSDKAKGSTSNLLSSYPDMEVKAGGGHQNDQVMFYSSNQSQHPYRGSQLSLAYKLDNSSFLSPSNIRMNSSMTSKAFENLINSSQGATNQPFLTEDMKQKPSTPKEHHHTQQQQISGERHSCNASGKMYLQNSRTNVVSNELQHQSFFTSYNKELTLIDNQMKQPDLVVSDLASGDSRTKFRKSAFHRTPTNRLTPSKSFQKDLMRLIDTEVPPSEISNKALDDQAELLSHMHLRHSDDNICFSSQKSYQSSDEIHHELFHQKLMPKNVIEIPGTVYRLHTSHSTAAISLPLGSSMKDEWSNLLEAATRTIEGNLNDQPLTAGTMGRNSCQSASSSSSSSTKAFVKPLELNDGQQKSNWRGTQQDVTNVKQMSGELNSENTRELENKIIALERQLQMERRERVTLEEEINQLRQDNIRLQEESQTAAAQLRKFTEWFFESIDRQ